MANYQFLHRHLPLLIPMHHRRRIRPLLLVLTAMTGTTPTASLLTRMILDGIAIATGTGTTKIIALAKTGIEVEGGAIGQETLMVEVAQGVRRGVHTERVIMDGLDPPVANPGQNSFDHASDTLTSTPFLSLYIALLGMPFFKASILSTHSPSF